MRITLAAIVICSSSFLLPCAGQFSLVDTFLLIKEEVVLFDFGRSDLPADAYADRFAAISRWYHQLDTFLFVQISGHTDSVGDPSFNYQLSRKRAQTVRDRLLALGIPDSLVLKAFFGETQPLNDNENDAARARNRRVQMRFLAKKRWLAIHGRLTDAATGEGLQGQILHRASAGLDSLPTDSSGFFDLLIPPEDIVTLEGYAPAYFFETRSFDWQTFPPDTLVELPLLRFNIGEVFLMENFYFHSNRPDLIGRSRPELAKLLHFLQVNPKIQIEIAGHVNVPNAAPVREDSWYYDLSVMRAKMVYDYLVEHGIRPFRLRYKGYGNWRLKFRQPKNAEEAQLNRRVEIHIIGDGKPVKLPPGKKSIPPPHSGNKPEY